MKETILKNDLLEVLINIVVPSISSIAAVITVIIAYQAIKVNKELFDEQMKQEDKKLLPTFGLGVNEIFLSNSVGLASNVNSNPNKITSLKLYNINPNPITDIRAVMDSFDEENNLLSQKVSEKHSPFGQGFILHIYNHIKPNKYKITLVYRTLSNKVSTSELIIEKNKKGEFNLINQINEK